jgi:hypothetical protein
MGALLTLPAGGLPFVCRAKESAVLVLFPVSSCTVVVTPGSGLMGVGGTPEPESPAEPPHATSIAIGPAKTATPSGIVNPLNLMASAPASFDTLRFAPDGSFHGHPIRPVKGSQFRQTLMLISTKEFNQCRCAEIPWNLLD